LSCFILPQKNRTSRLFIPQKSIWQPGIFKVSLAARTPPVGSIQSSNVA